MTNAPTAGPVTAPYELVIEKYLNAIYWTNRYYINASTIDDAAGVALNIYQIERNSLFDNVTISKYTVRTTTKEDYVFRTLTPNAKGLRAKGTTELMPLFVCLRVDLQTNGGRPSRKYYRGMLNEADVNMMDVIAATVSSYQTSVANALAGVVGLCDPQGQVISGATIKPQVAIRQLRRGSKKKKDQ